MTKFMGYNGIEFTGEDVRALRDAFGVMPFDNNMTRGCMTFTGEDGVVYMVPADETIEGIHARLREYTTTGDNTFARDYHKAERDGSGRVY